MIEDYQLIVRLLQCLDRGLLPSPEAVSLSDAVGLEPDGLERLLLRWCGMDSRQVQQCLSPAHIRVMLGQCKESCDGSGSAELQAVEDVEIQPCSEKQAEQEYAFQATPFGWLLIVRRIGGGISYAAFCDSGDNAAALIEAEQLLSTSLVRENKALATPLADPVSTVFGETRLLEPEGSDFQLRVWRALATLRAGEVISYGQLADMIDCPKGVRAVASAVARNPIAGFIPCHRVVLGDGRVGQYRWGGMRKQAMLVWENGRTQSGSV